MGGCRCSYKNCPNTTKTTENVHFFHYPVKHKERCKIWIENAKKPHFCDLEEDQLRNKVICEFHFEDKWFPNWQKKRLLQGAVPTLDGPCEPEEPDPEPVHSTDIQDIPVLPANDDGTIFVLDTDSIFNRSQKIESYIYKNGTIIPSTSKPTKPQGKPLQIAKPSTSNNQSEYYQPVTLNSNLSYDSNISYEPMEDDEYKVIIKKEESPEYEQTKENEEDYINDQSQGESGMRKIGARAGMRAVIMDKKLGRNYRRKIQQHSRDIATIKKMLKQKMLAQESKPDMNTILNSIKEQLPPTFFTILNLNLNNKCDLTDDDVDFFTTIHKVSPEVYQLLIEKYKWNLPCVDIVDTSIE